MNYEKNQEYLIHRFTEIVPAPAIFLTFEVLDVITSPYIVPAASAGANIGVAWTDVVLWTGKLKSTKGRAKPTGIVDNNNGLPIYNVDNSDLYGGLPWLHNNWYIPQRFEMRACMGVPQNGQIWINFDTSFSPSDTATPPTVVPTVCRVWLPVIKRKANETHVSCTYVPA